MKSEDVCVSLLLLKQSGIAPGFAFWGFRCDAKCEREGRRLLFVGKRCRTGYGAAHAHAVERAAEGAGAGIHGDVEVGDCAVVHRHVGACGHNLVGSDAVAG